MTTSVKSSPALKPYVFEVMDFFNEIGIKTSVKNGVSAFLEFVKIIDGSIEIDPRCTASNLLHEGGHLAIIPSQFRHLMSGDLDEGLGRMYEEIGRLNLDPDSPLSRAAMQASETEATAWAWAVAEHLGLPPEMAIEDSDYDGEGHNMRCMLKARAYLGINGLMHAGFCVNRVNPYRDLPVYPTLAFWMQK